MTDANHHESLPHCQTSGDDPKISVHELTEFVFCRRAGLVTRDKPIESQERDLLPGLGYLDNYEPQQIRQLFAAEYETLTKYAAFSLIPAATGVIFLLLDSLPTGLVLLAVAVVIWSRAFPHVKVAFDCQRQLRLIERAKQLRIDLFAQRPQSAGWWELLTEFQLRRGTGVYHDDQCQLCGSMQAVLVKGSLRIPVFWLRSLADGTLKEQHFVRMAAYCHLLEACEGAESPCGVVVMPDSFLCATVPNTAAARQKLFARLRTARRTILAADGGDDPPAPSPALCSNCHHGKPARLTDVDDFDESADSDTILMSDCGARFGWQPPYTKSPHPRR